MPEVFHFGNAWLDKKCNELAIPSVIVPGHRFYKSIRTIPIFALSFCRFLKKRNINMLHSHLYGSITGACLSAFSGNIPHIGTLHDNYTIEEKKIRIYSLLLAAFLGARLVAVSEKMRELLETSGKFPKRRLQTILNGVDLRKFDRPIKRELAYELRLNSNDIILICVGRLVDIKGHDILIEAFSRLKSEKQLKLLIVGDGPNMDHIRALVSQKGLIDNIKLLGLRDDVPSLLKLSDCFVLSSHSEGLSCSIIEAMASGLPAIATNVGGNFELIEDGKSGYLVPPNDPNVLAQRIQVLIDDEERRKDFGELSLRLAREKFSLQKMVTQYVEIYRTMIG